MKLSITLILATIASMTIGSEARIGGGEKYDIYVSNTCHNEVTAREQNQNQGVVVKASSCKLWDSDTTESSKSFFFDTQSNKAGTGSVRCQKIPNPYECQQFMMHKKLPDNACVITVPSSMCDDRKLEDDTTAPADAISEVNNCWKKDTFCVPAITCQNCCNSWHHPYFLTGQCS